MKILFSCIGTADPITMLGDGPMLHIARHYKPGKIVLYLSPAMTRYQDMDCRYSKSIELLAESVDAPIPEIEMIRSDFDEVYRFDHYIPEFEDILQGLEKEASGESVLVNVSSGTAGMTQALVALGAFGRLNLSLLQVLTPKNGINKSDDREDPDDYDLLSLWELNKDNEAYAECRVVGVESPNFNDRVLKEHAAALVGGYEYEAAYKLVQNTRSVSPEAKNMILAAADRLNLKPSLPAKVFKGTNLAYKPEDKLGEYLFAMEVRLMQQHWGEFARMLTPAFTKLMKRALNPYLAEKQYLKFSGHDATDELNREVIYQDGELLKILKPENGALPRYITNDGLAKLVDNYCDDSSTRKCIEKLRSFEKKSRNPLAHQIIASSKETLEKNGGMTLEEVMESLFKLHGNIEPGLYRRINERIFELM